MGGAAENMGSLPPQCAPRARHGELDGFERQSQLRIWRQRNLDGGWRRTLLEGPRTGCSFIFPAARTSTLESCSSILLPLHWLRFSSLAQLFSDTFGQSLTLVPALDSDLFPWRHVASGSRCPFSCSAAAWTAGTPEGILGLGWRTENTKLSSHWVGRRVGEVCPVSFPGLGTDATLHPTGATRRSSASLGGEDGEGGVAERGGWKKTRIKARATCWPRSSQT
uniref:uncharacterized protein LOC132662076 n=1 Tax=Panthera onca TaxID=9690 RepID=UPI002954838D|nr:uncharacterized protein LOC132662076 [Panthera onca]